MSDLFTTPANARTFTREGITVIVTQAMVDAVPAGALHSLASPARWDDGERCCWCGRLTPAG